jgi:hypothetical protein
MCSYKQSITLWLARNQDNVSEWDDMSISGLLFQWASITKIQLSMLVYIASTKRASSSSHWKLTCSRHDTLPGRRRLSLKSKQQIPGTNFIVFDRDSNPRSTTFEPITPTITTYMRFPTKTINLICPSVW